MEVRLAKAGFPAHGPLNGLINEKTKRKNASCKTSQESARSRPKKACRNLVQNDDYLPTAGSQVRTAEGGCGRKPRPHPTRESRKTVTARGGHCAECSPSKLTGGLSHRAGHGRRGQVKDLKRTSTKADSRQQATARRPTGGCGRRRERGRVTGNRATSHRQSAAGRKQQKGRP